MREEMVKNRSAANERIDCVLGWALVFLGVYGDFREAGKGVEAVWIVGVRIGRQRTWKQNPWSLMLLLAHYGLLMGAQASDWGPECGRWDHLGIAS